MLVLLRASPLGVAARGYRAASAMAAKSIKRSSVADLFLVPLMSSTSTTSLKNNQNTTNTNTNTLHFLHTCPVVCGRRSAKIATRKGAQDLKKAKLYGKLGKLILASARQGGPDPVANPKLRDAIAAAKQAALPRDIIERNIKKASEKGSGADFSETLYEAYGPGGKTSFIALALTDNVNRTAAEVKTAVKAGGGKVADGGSVKFGFVETGVIVLDREAGGGGADGGGAKELDEDTVLEAAAEAGADDAVQAGSTNRWRVLAAVDQFGHVRDALSAAGLPVAADASGLEWIPKTPVELDADSEDFEANERLYQKLMEVTDVDAVFCSCPGVGAGDEDE